MARGQKIHFHLMNMHEEREPRPSQSWDIIKHQNPNFFFFFPSDLWTKKLQLSARSCFLGAAGDGIKEDFPNANLGFTRGRVPAENSQKNLWDQGRRGFVIPSKLGGDVGIGGGFGGVFFFFFLCSLGRIFRLGYACLKPRDFGRKTQFFGSKPQVFGSKAKVFFGKNEKVLGRK